MLTSITAKSIPLCRSRGCFPDHLNPTEGSLPLPRQVKQQQCWLRRGDPYPKIIWGRARGRPQGPGRTPTGWHWRGTEVSVCPPGLWLYQTPQGMGFPPSLPRGGCNKEAEPRQLLPESEGAARLPAAPLLLQVTVEAPRAPASSLGCELD